MIMDTENHEVESYETVKIKRSTNSVIWQEFTSDYHGREGTFQSFVNHITKLGIEQYQKGKSSG